LSQNHQHLFQIISQKYFLYDNSDPREQFLKWGLGRNFGLALQWLGVYFSRRHEKRVQNLTSVPVQNRPYFAKLLGKNIFKIITGPTGRGDS
jgi:hypothetical protein